MDGVAYWSGRESVLIRGLFALITAIPLPAEAVTHLDGFIPRLLGVVRPRRKGGRRDHAGGGDGSCRRRGVGLVVDGGGSCRVGG